MCFLCDADSYRARAVTDWRVFDSGLIYKKFFNLVQTGIQDPESGIRNPESGIAKTLIKISYKIIIFVTFIFNLNGCMYIEVIHNPPNTILFCY
jgi:hypothetical protein